MNMVLFWVFFPVCSCHSEAPKPVVTPRPERLVKRLKSVTLDDANAPRLIVLRQPRGPDSTKVPPHCKNMFKIAFFISVSWNKLISSLFLAGLQHGA